ncbi:hypothetical protein ACSMX9_04915 [Streptomyces sp. LE64]|uniref:hypothetical protein n=1 Tax=unclassified Streptomyces TaxID=2593676 RepID=UPI003331EB9E
MGVTIGRTLSLGTLARLDRHRKANGRGGSTCPLRLALPTGMSVPLGCDAVSVPSPYARRVNRRLPRVGCVYADLDRWWWIVPSDSDVALEWPAPARYACGALLPDEGRPPGLIHRPDATVPYTPPIPLYLALCRVTGTPPSWCRVP